MSNSKYDLHIQARAKRFDLFSEDADPDNELDQITERR